MTIATPVAVTPPTPSGPRIFHRLSFRFALKQRPDESRQVLGGEVLQILGRVFLAILVPTYLGYVGASLNMFDVYLLVAASWSLWAYGQPGPQELWESGGIIAIIKGWLVMVFAILLVAGPAYGIGYLIAKYV
ncbi:hypothetical protein [Nitrobacter vulgaris]|uniref:hypothetical protein n=1 Tax=Nitrobacter vulgaris TaxID=29421 RepID=UPI00286B58A6|nr:hypothetical protein [Nitrobacter vulgaris]